MDESAGTTELIRNKILKYKRPLLRPFVVILVSMENKLIKVFYDGDCRVCDAEISHYMRIARDAGIEYVNINDPEFDSAYYGKSRDDFMTQMHVMDPTGSFHVGVDAFRLLWRKLPGVHYQMLATLTGLPGINLMTRIGYRLFASNRHRLPRKSK